MTEEPMVATDPLQQHGATATDVLVGAIAGVAATVAMTLAAAAMHRHLPESQRYPLPPRELTEQALARGGGHRPGLVAATLASHFGFGAAVGGLYGFLRLGRTPAAACSGILYGLGVWTVSYLGWIPASRLLRPATGHPARRNALMIAAHVVWGITLGVVDQRLRGSLAPFGAGTLKDR